MQTATVNQSTVGKRIVATSRISKKQKKFSILGTEYREEFSGTRTSTEVLYIGHASMPKTVMLKLIFSCVVKKLFQLVGNLTSDLSISLPFVQPTDVIRYQERTDANAAWVNVDRTIAVTGSSVAQIIDYYVNAFENAN